jgi:hypothetical protein
MTKSSKGELTTLQFSSLRNHGRRKNQARTALEGRLLALPPDFLEQVRIGANVIEAMFLDSRPQVPTAGSSPTYAQPRPAVFCCTASWLRGFPIKKRGALGFSMMPVLTHRRAAALLRGLGSRGQSPRTGLRARAFGPRATCPVRTRLPLPGGPPGGSGITHEQTGEI